MELFAQARGEGVVFASMWLTEDIDRFISTYMFAPSLT